MTPGDPGFNPFPGLRPFDMDEEYLFFGREDQRKELVSLLREQRFVAVLGASGSGKSSLVRAGLLPALYGGVMTRAGSNWHIAVMRPGGHAITNLAESLFDTDLLDNEICEDLTELDIEATLIRSSLGLIEAARQLGLQKNENLLVVVDQFEELFRFNSSQSDRGSRDEAAAFVKMLVEAANQEDLSIYVVLTMRSDFFGDCSQFEELAEAVNKGEYLVPRLNRENKKTAIEGPVRVGGGEISPRLVQRLLNDLGDDPDQLPIMQHALMRTWDCWLADHGEDEPLDLRHYESTGGMDEALSRHADEVHAEASGVEEQRLTRQLFQALTEKGADNRGIRRPTPLQELCAITGAEQEKVVAVIDRFRKPGRTFLMPPIDRELEGGTVIDISHESLMRVWLSLGRWVDDEAQSARIYRRLAETAQLHADGSAGLYHDPDLQIALSWRENEHPTEAWGSRYHQEYAQAIGFLEQSHEVNLEEQRAEEAARERELEQAKRLAKAEQDRAEAQQQLAVKQRKRAKIAAVLAGLALIATAVAGVAWNQSKKSESLAKQAKSTAEENATKAAEAQKIAEAQEALAKQSQEAAEKAQQTAEEASANLSKTLTESDFITGTEFLESGKTPEGLAYLARAIRRDPTFWQATMRAMSVLEDQNFSLDLRPPLEHERAAQYPIVSKDESIILTYVQTGEARTWDPATGKMAAEFGSDIYAAELSSDGKIAALQDSKNGLTLWHTDSGKAAVEIKPEQGVRTFTFARHKNGDYIATFNVSGSLQLWNLDGTEHTKPLRTEGTFLGTRNTKPGINEEGTHLYGLFNDGFFACWDVESGELTCPPIRHGIKTFFSQISNSGKWGLVGAQDGKTIRWWDLKTGESPMSEPIKFQRAIGNIQFSPDENRLYLIGTGNNTVSYSAFDTKAGNRLYEDAIDVPAQDISVDSKHSKIIIKQNNFNLNIVDLRNNKKAITLPRQEVAMGNVKFTPYGERFAVTHNDNTIRIRSTNSGAPVTKPLKHNGKIDALIFNETGTILASRDNTGIWIWNALAGQLITGPLIHEGFIGLGGNAFLKKHNTLFSWDYTYSATPTGSKLTRGTTKLWSTSIRAKLDTQLDEGTYGPTEFTPDNKSLIAIKLIEKNDDDEKRKYEIQSWDVATQVKQKSTVYTNSLSGLTLHPTMDYIFLADTNQTVNVLTNKSLESIAQLEHPAKVRSGTIAPAKDKPILLVPTEDSAVHIWDVSKNKKITRIKLNHPNVRGSISPDGKLVSTYGGDDNAAIVWDAASGEQVAGPLIHDNVIIHSYFNSGGNGRLITLTGEPKINIWDIKTNKLLQSTDTTDWPTRSELVGNLLMTAGNGNDDYPSAIRLWDPKDLRSLITPIDYEGAIQHARLLRDNELVAAKDNKNLLRVWGTKLGRPLTTAKKNTPSAKFGTGNYYATDSSRGLFLHTIPGKVEHCPDWFPGLLENLAGKSVNEDNIFVNTPKGGLKQNLELISNLPGDSHINRWGQWFISNSQDRPISAASTRSITSYLENLSKSERGNDLRQVLIRQPDYTLAKSRLAVITRQFANLRYESANKAFDNNEHTIHVQHKSSNAGLTINTKMETVTGMTITTASFMPARDPVRFTLFGAKHPSDNYKVITTQRIPLVNERKSKIKLDINNNEAYDSYRIVFHEVRSTIQTTQGTQVSEIELLNSSGEDITSPDDKVEIYLGEDMHINGVSESLAREAAEDLPDTPETIWALADTLDGLGKHKEARKQIERAMKLAPDDPNVLLIKALIDREDEEQCEAHFAKSIDAITSKKHTNDVLHPLLRKVAKLEKATPVQLIGLATKLTGGNSWGDRFLFGFLLAKYSATKAPDNLDVAIGYSEVLSNSGQYAKTGSVLENLTEKNSDNPELWLAIGFNEIALENHQSALDKFQKTIDLLKGNSRKSIELRSKAYRQRARILRNELKQPLAAHREELKATIPPRPTTAPDNLIDLTSHYTAPIRGMGSIQNSNAILTTLPIGVNTYSGNQYDTRGMIYLSGKQQEQAKGEKNPYPKKVEGIQVDQKLNVLKFLQATTWTDPDGTPVANYIIHYDDGTNVTIPVIYGVHLRDWYQEEANRNLKTPEAEIVYRGWAGNNFPFGLYQQVWKNPHPEKTIKTIDIVGQNSFSNFFLVGMSGEAQSSGEDDQKESSPEKNNNSPKE